jgi:hypothetical protein
VCKRVSDAASKTLKGCEVIAHKENWKCTKSNGIETCYCSGNLCNGAMMGSASMTAIVLTLASFVAVFVHWTTLKAHTSEYPKYNSMNKTNYTKGNHKFSFFRLEIIHNAVLKRIFNCVSSLHISRHEKWRFS